MFEVDGDGNEIGNDPAEPKSKKSKDKSKDLMKKLGHRSAGKPMDAKQKKKEAERNEYGDLDDSDEGGPGGSDSDDVDLPGVEVPSSMQGGKRSRGKKEKGYFAQVKWSHIAILFMMMAGGMLPVIMMAADVLGPKLTAGVNAVLPSLQPYLVGAGLSPAPKKRLNKFYEKHKPEKMEEVDKILLKYAGDYKTMTKKLESKYNDYGYFMNWEQEEGFKAAQKQTYEYVAKTSAKLYQKCIPFPIRMGVNRVYGNALFAYTKALKLVDKWTNADGSGGDSSKRRKSSSSSGSSQSSGSKGSRRARNSQARED